MEEKRRKWRCWFSYLSEKIRWKATSTAWLFLDVLKCHVEGENVMSETIRRYCRKEDARNTIFFLSTSVKRMYAYIYTDIVYRHTCVPMLEDRNWKTNKFLPIAIDLSRRLAYIIDLSFLDLFTSFFHLFLVI